MKKAERKIKKDNWEGFDDCPICKAMKNGEAGNAKDLMKVFQEAGKSGAVVGGDFINKNMPKMTMRTASKNDLYYDAMEALDVSDFETAKKFLKKAQDLDSHYVQTYIGFANLYGLLGEKKKAEENIKIAFKKTLEKFSKWPRKMPWFDLDNRAYLRAIQYQADLYQDENKKEKAVELYRLLLKLNPNDNQGVRYVLAGLYAGIDGKKINQMFDEGNKKQDWSSLEKLVDLQNKKYLFWNKPKDF